MASVTDYSARVGAEEYQSSLFKCIHVHGTCTCLQHSQGCVGSLQYLGDSFTTKHERNNPLDKYTVAVLPVNCHSKIITPWRVNRQHSLDISLGKRPPVLLLFASNDRTATAYLLCGLFRSYFVEKPSPRK